MPITEYGRNHKMNIKTKFELGQLVYALYQGKLYSGNIRNIFAEVTQAGKVKISYVLGGASQSPATYGRDESEIFGSPEELLASCQEVKS